MTGLSCPKICSSSVPIAETRTFAIAKWTAVGRAQLIYFTVSIVFRQVPNPNPNLGFTGPWLQRTGTGYSGPSPIVASFVSTKHRNVTEGQTDTAMANKLCRRAVKIFLFFR